MGVLLIKKGGVVDGWVKIIDFIVFYFIEYWYWIEISFGL